MAGAGDDMDMGGGGGFGESGEESGEELLRFEEEEACSLELE